MPSMCCTDRLTIRGRQAGIFIQLLCTYMPSWLLSLERHLWEVIFCLAGAQGELKLADLKNT